MDAANPAGVTQKSGDYSIFAIIPIVYGASGVIYKLVEETKIGEIWEKREKICQIFPHFACNKRIRIIAKVVSAWLTWRYVFQEKTAA